MTESFCDAPHNNDKIPATSWHGHDFLLHEVTSQVPHFEISDVAVEVRALGDFPNFIVGHLRWCSQLGQEQVSFRTMSKKPKWINLLLPYPSSTCVPKQKWLLVLVPNQLR